MRYNTNEKIKVIIVDDHTLFRTGLKATFQPDFFNIEVVGEAGGGEELFGVLKITQADLILLDINLPDMNGAEIARRLRCDYPDIKILAISAENTPKAVEAMLNEGINGFISKQKSDAHELSEAIHAVMNGLEYFGRDISSIIYDVYVAKKRSIEISSEFTEREKEVITLCSEGLIYKEIADRMGISFHTVNTHKKNIFQKLGINNTMEMVQYALKNGIIRMCLFIAVIFFCSNHLHAQVRPFDQKRVDSLEKVLNTPSLSDEDFFDTCESLFNAYAREDGKKSLEYVWKAIRLAEKKKYYYQLAGFYYDAGAAYYYLRKMDSSLYYLELSLTTMERAKKKELTGDEDFEFLEMLIFNTKGNLHSEAGKYDLALDNFFTALGLVEKMGIPDIEASIFHNIANCYGEMSNYSKEEVYLLKAQKIYRDLDNPIKLADNYTRLSATYAATGNYPKALKLTEEAYRILNEIPNISAHYLIDVTIRLTDIWTRIPDYNKALKYALQSIEYAKELKVPDKIAFSYALLSRCYLQLNRYREAEEFAFRSLEIDSSSIYSNSQVYEIIAISNIWLKNCAKAQKYFKKTLAANREYSTQNYQASISEMEVKYETEKKEYEIAQQQNIISRQNLLRNILMGCVAVSVVILALLWVMLRLRKRHNQILTEMNATKDKFFSIISHDLRNPAIAQRDAIQQLVKNANLWKDEELTNYCNDLLKSADEEVELLHTLLNWAQVQTGRMNYMPAVFDLSAHLRTDIALIRKMAEFKKITLTDSMPKQAPVTGDSNMIITVVRNLLTNAVKFTSVGGQISLTIEATPNGKYTVSVRDTGAGMTVQQIQNLFNIEKLHSSKGTIGEQGSGLGLIVCKELLKKHGSVLHIESEKEKGSVFWFELTLH
jgi:DNA-binding NarL/FixJ family response regulator/signal transduction histidine kinase